jgi:hypothetical protein
MIAKPVIKNKFWIVENDGKPVATIQAGPTGVALVHDEYRELFPSIKILSARYNIKVSRSIIKPLASASPNNTIYGFPINSKSFNEVYDVKRQLPFYTKTAKSKSQFCAGHYAVQINRRWVTQFCPKAITLNRYEYLGPFVSEEQAKTAIPAK